MAKIAISTASYFGTAITDLLYDAGYDTAPVGGDCSYVLVNTTKHTAKGGSTAGDRPVLCPTTDWATISALVNAATGGAQAPAAVTPTRYFDAVALPAPAAIIPVDAAGNPLAVGDTVLVITPASSKPVFTLRTNGVAVITRITAKGALGFAFDEANEFLSKRFQRVTLRPATLNAADYIADVTSGDLVVARPGRHSGNADNASKFALPTDTALVFRGVTLDKGNFILDGYAEHQYSPQRFSVLTRVGAVRS